MLFSSLQVDMILLLEGSGARVLSVSHMKFISCNATAFTIAHYHKMNVWTNADKMLFNLSALLPVRNCSDIMSKFHSSNDVMLRRTSIIEPPPLPLTLYAESILRYSRKVLGIKRTISSMLWCGSTSYLFVPHSIAYCRSGWNYSDGNRVSSRMWKMQN